MRLQVLTASAAIAVASFSFTVRAEPLRPATLAEEGHKHGEDEKQKLGRQKIGSYTVSVIIIGDLHDDKEIKFDIKLIDAKLDPKALRVWIGTEDAKDAEKAEGKKGETTYTGEAKVPSPLPPGTKVWVEIETNDGVTKGSYAVEDKHDHKK